MPQAGPRNDRQKNPPPSRALARAAAAAPPNLEEIQRGILRKLAEVVDQWRNCPHRACRRHRRCASPRFECLTRIARRPVSAERQAAAMAQLHRELQRRLAAIADETR